MRIEYEAVLFTNIRQSESKQVNIAQMEKDFRMYFRYFFFLRLWVDSKYMQKDHQQMRSGSLALFLNGQIAKPLPPPKPGFSANSWPAQYFLDLLPKLVSLSCPTPRILHVKRVESMGQFPS